MNNPILAVKKLLKIKHAPPFVNIEEEILKNNGVFKFFFIMTSAQQKTQVFFKPKRIHLLKGKNGETLLLECLIKNCPACELYKNSKKIDHQSKSRFLYHIATPDHRFLLLDVGSNLHSNILEMKRICEQFETDLFNNPELIVSLTNVDQEYRINTGSTIGYSFSSNTKSYIENNITLHEDKYLKVSSDEMLKMIELAIN